MLLVNMLFVIGVVGLISMALYASESDWIKAWFACVLAVLLLGSNVYVVAPYFIGSGIVTDNAEELKKRLDDKKTYQVVASTKDGDNYVLLVKIYGSSDFYALRVKEMPPEIFTMIKDKPVAIARQDPLANPIKK